jgi:tetratricopeptide (TPR) repeat protein
MVGSGGELVARFRRERQILATLEHRNIARLLDGGTNERGEPYFVMEYVEGVPITAYCDANTLSITDRLRLFLQVFAAVEHAHGKLIVHRDLKPANMLVAGDGSVKLLDFGVAKLLGAQDNEQLTTVAQSRPFTPEYASPEQLRDEPVSVASDVYALGVVLYELLAGRRPHLLGSRSPIAMLRAVESETPRPSAVATGDAARFTGEATLDRLRARLSGELDNVLRKALRTDPGLRYRSVEQFSADVRCYLEGKPVSAQPDRWTYRLRKFVGRHRGALAATAVATTALATAAVAFATQAHHADVERNWQLAVTAASSLDELATSQLFGGDVRGADTLLRHAYALCGTQPSLRDVTSGCVRVTNDFGMAALWQGDLRRADPLLSRVYRLVQGPAINATVLARVTSEMGQLRDAEGDYVGAERLYRAADPLFKAVPSDRSTERIDYLGWFSICLERQGRYAEADSLVRLELVATGGNGEVLLHLALIETEENRLDLARSNARRAAPLIAPELGDTTGLLSVMVLAADGIVRLRLGQVDSSVVELRTGLGVASRRYRPDDPRLAQAQDALGRALLAQGHRDDAARYFRLAATTYRDRFGPRHPQAAATAAELAQATVGRPTMVSQ